MLEDLIIAAFTDAKGKAETAVQAKMQEVTGGSGSAAGTETVLTAALYRRAHAFAPLRRVERGDGRNAGGRGLAPTASGPHPDKGEAKSRRRSWWPRAVPQTPTP